MMREKKYILFLFVFLTMISCREDEEIFIPENVTVSKPEAGSDIAGFYLLNEGNMGSNKSTLDYYSYATGIYTRNIYGNANPTVPKELGDVGNDIQIYGSKLYAVINCSNKVEVMNATDTKRIGQIDIPNCRYIKFHEGYAYVTSYAGPVEINPNYEQKGYVAKVDTATLKVTDACVVGFQPDELEIVDGKIYVANSGGYMVPNYENTLSVIDIATFKEVERVPIAINLQCVTGDKYGGLWVSTRGDYYDEESKLYCYDVRKKRVEKVLDIPVSSMWLDGDFLYVVSIAWSNITMTDEVTYAVVDVKNKEIVTRNFITDGTDKKIKKPYGVAVNPITKDIYVTDAKQYVTPGTLYCFSQDGVMKWSVRTGDIPAHFAFVGNETQQTTPVVPSKTNAYISKVYDFVPAPGQFVNMIPEYEPGDDKAAIIAKVEASICGNETDGACPGMISLGAWGGYVVFGFDHPVVNVKGEYDFKIYGNAFSSSDGKQKGSSEPGIVMVSYDENGNGVPDDKWYELAGSEYDSPATIHDYEITYYKPSADHVANPDPGYSYVTDQTYIKWTDNKGGTGYVMKNSFHNQSYWAEWIDDESMTFRGTQLADNAVKEGTLYVQTAYDYGYVDNLPNVIEPGFKIDWAVDENGNSIHLPAVHFIKVYNAVNQYCGWIGETSTEICGGEDLHPEAE